VSECKADGVVLLPQVPQYEYVRRSTLSDPRIHDLGIRCCDWSVPHVPAALLPVAVGWKTDGPQFCSEHTRGEGGGDILPMSGVELRSLSRTAHIYGDSATE
jgi:hypothetical protein